MADTARIKRNISKMLTLGATEDEIDAYIAGEGTTAEELRGAAPKPETSVTADVASQFGQGFNRGLDSTLDLVVNTPYNLIRAGAGALGADTSEEGWLPPPEPITPISGLLNSGEGPQTTAGRYAGTIGEVAGGSVAPAAGMVAAGRQLGARAIPALQRAASDIGRTAAYEGVAAAGAGTGIQAARDAELGPVGELAAGVAGGVVAPFGYAAAARAGDTVKSAARFGNEMLRMARDPEQAAYQRTADSLVASGAAPAALRGELLTDARGKPMLSQQLAARGINEAGIAEMIARRLQGESAAALSAEYGVAPSTINTYAAKFGKSTPTPMTIPDLAVELRGEGAAMPVLRQGRAAYGMAGDESAEAAKAFYDRQSAQSGRMAETIRQSGGRARLEDEIDRLRGVAKQQEHDAYTTAYQHQAPVMIDDVIRDWRGRAFGRSGEISKKLQEAIDGFYTPEMREPPQTPSSFLQVREAQDRLRKAIRDNAPQERIDWLRRRAIIAEKQDEWTRMPRLTKVGKPVQDLRRFIDSRQNLDQMIRTSYHEGKPTPLTDVLTEFRTAVNNAARANNPALRSADARFYGNRTAERIIERGSELGKRLTPDTREAMREFRSMTPEQQELFRVAFEQRLTDDALNVRLTGGAANQFNTRGFEELVNAFYPEPARSARGAERAAQQAAYDRGQTLLRNMKREAISTATGSFMTGRGNSPTAPWLTDIQAGMEAASTAADVALGRVGQLQEKLANRLTRQVGERAAREQLRILSEMNEPALLLMLNRLDRAAQGTAGRQALVHQLRELRRPRLRPGAQVGVVPEVFMDEQNTAE